MTHTEFKELAPSLTEKLAEAFIEKMKEMGPEKVKEISWFNSKFYPNHDFL